LLNYGKLRNFPDYAITMIHYHMTQTCSDVFAVRTPVIHRAGLSSCRFIVNDGEILSLESDSSSFYDKKNETTFAKE